MKTQTLSILILFFTLIACKKDGEDKVANLYQTWEAKTFMSVESVTYPKTEGKKILLTFDKSGVYQVQLDVNYCNGNFTQGDNGQLQIQSAGCSKACCDSKFSEKLIDTLPKVTAYQMEGNTLKLTVPKWGYIQLELSE